MVNILRHLDSLSLLISSSPATEVEITAKKTRTRLDAGSLAAGASAIPASLDELNSLVVQSYDLSMTAAANLSIPIIGSGGGSVNRRIVILEQSAYRESDDNGTLLHYGYCVRFCVTVSKWDANLKLTLPFLAASAEVGSISARWTLQILGLSGPKIHDALPPPTELNVEKFVLAKQSLEKIIAAIKDPKTKFKAELIRKIEPEQQRIAAQRLAIAQTYALSCIERGRTLSESIRRAGYDTGDFEYIDAIRDVYYSVGIQDDNSKPGDETRRKARDILNGVKADV
jgi:hypothetical protein